MSLKYVSFYSLNTTDLNEIQLFYYSCCTIEIMAEFIEKHQVTSNITAFWYKIYFESTYLLIKYIFLRV